MLARRIGALATALALGLTATAAAEGGGKKHDDNGGKGLKRVDHIVVIYEENHSFDNLYGGWEGVNGLAQRRRGAHHAGQPGRRRRTPACRRTTSTSPSPAAVGDVHRHDDAARRSTATSRTRRSRSTTTSRRPRRRARRPASSPPNGVLERHRPARRLHPRPRAPLLPGAVPARRRQAGPLRRPGSDARRAHAWAYYDTRALPIYQYLHAQGAPALRDRRQLLPGGVRRLVPQPPVADRRAHAGRGRTRSTTAAPTTCTPCVDANGMPTNYPLYTPTGRRCTDAAADASCAPPAAAAATPAVLVRRLRRQHDPAGLPALLAGHGRRRRGCRRRPRRRSATG